MSGDDPSIETSAFFSKIRLEARALMKRLKRVKKLLSHLRVQ